MAWPHPLPRSHTSPSRVPDPIPGQPRGSRGGTLPTSGLLLVLAALFSHPAAAQPVVPACDLRCPAPRICEPTDRVCQRHNEEVVRCQTEQASCQAKFMAYDAYLQQMGLGVTPLSLPALYREVLDPLYPQASLSGYRFGFSNRQPANNATTDCDRTWYNNADYVSAIQNGTVSENGQGPGFYWLLHEIAHYEQCRVVGSRDAYARMWWDHLSETELVSLIETGGWGTIHSQMRMEQEAKTRAQEVLFALDQCCIHPTTGRLVRPLAVTPMQVTPAGLTQGASVTFSANASGGAEPLSWAWEVRDPHAGAWTTLPATGPSATFVPQADGSWTVRLSVSQPHPGLRTDHREERTFNVLPPEPRVTSVSVSPELVIGGTSAQGTVQVADIAPGGTVQVSLQSHDPSLVQVPAAVSVTAGTSGGGIATFPVSTVLLPVDRNVTITASAPGGSASGTLFVGGVILEGILVDRDVLRLGEPIQVELRFERAAPFDVTIRLESSDARTLGVPPEVILPRGQRSVTVPLRATTELSRETPVTLRARLAQDPVKTVEQEVRVLPRQ
jgi:hypothetical protein